MECRSNEVELKSISEMLISDPRLRPGIRLFSMPERRRMAAMICPLVKIELRRSSRAAGDIVTSLSSNSDSILYYAGLQMISSP